MSSSSSAAAAKQRCIVPVTPLTIGKVMSNDDAHYAPHRGENPFPSRFRNAAAKLVSSGGGDDSDTSLLSPNLGLETPPPTPITPQDVDVTGSSIWCQSWRSHSLPGSREGSRIFGLVGEGAGSDDGGASSADSAVEFDVADDSTGAAARPFIERGGRRKSHHNAEHAAVLVRCLEQLRVLLDTDSSQTDCSSCASLDEAVFSPTSSMSGRDDYMTDVLQRPAPGTTDCRPSAHERFRALVDRWEEAGQTDVVLPARLRFADLHLMQRFAELRRMWESQQTSTSFASSASTSSSSSSAAAASAAASIRSQTGNRRSHRADKQ